MHGYARTFFLLCAIGLLFSVTAFASLGTVQDDNAPELVTPAAGAVLPTSIYRWTFSWKAPANRPRVKEFELWVGTRGSRRAFLQQRVSRTAQQATVAFVYSDTIPGQKTEAEPGEWVWRVAAVGTTGQVGPWSEERSFKVSAASPKPAAGLRPTPTQPPPSTPPPSPRTPVTTGPTRNPTPDPSYITNEAGWVRLAADSPLWLTDLVAYQGWTKDIWPVRGPLARTRGVWLFSAVIHNEGPASVWIMPLRLTLQDKTALYLFPWSGKLEYVDVEFAQFYQPVPASSIFIELKPKAFTSVALFAEHAGQPTYDRMVQFVPRVRQEGNQKTEFTTFTPLYLKSFLFLQCPKPQIEYVVRPTDSIVDRLNGIVGVIQKVETLGNGDLRMLQAPATKDTFLRFGFKAADPRRF